MIIATQLQTINPQISFPQFWI